jgi:hypothetical protein
VGITLFVLVCAAKKIKASNNMDECEEALYNMYREVNLVALSLSPAASLQTITPLQVHRVLASCLTFEQRLSVIDSNLKQVFKDKHFTMLSKCVFFLRNTKQPSLRSIHDRVFVSKLDFKRQIPRGTTRMFEEFIKGITFFAGEEDPQQRSPIYHRLVSCGPGTQSFRNAFLMCKNEMDPANRDEVKMRITKCYIERLIYDAIYKENELAFGEANADQDDGHVNWLRQTKHDFRTCFPGLNLKVEVTFDQHMPIQLILTRLQNKKQTSVERYLRYVSIDQYGHKYYEEHVDCYRQTLHRSFYRVQNFNHIIPAWHRVQTA